MVSQHHHDEWTHHVVLTKWSVWGTVLFLFTLTIFFFSYNLFIKTEYYDVVGEKGDEGPPGPPGPKGQRGMPG